MAASRPWMARTARVAIALLVLAWPSTGRALVSSSTGSDPPFTGLNINEYLGADTFYNAGYYGTRAVLANIEAGHIWTGHDTLGHVAQLIDGGGAQGDFDRHATFVGHTLGGRVSVPEEYERGIAYGSELWSGAIATSWSSQYSFSITYSSLTYAYDTVMLDGVGGQTADVINSSWGDGNDHLGDGVLSRYLDAVTNTSGKIVVMAAGNDGTSGTNTLGGPASAFNTIAVAALGTDTSAPPYDDDSSFSSRSPTDFFLPDNASGSTGTTTTGVRAAIDIAAPGQELTLAYYGGTTGGNASGSDPTGGSGSYYGYLVAGTSFAAPIVAGGAALVVDVGYDQFGGGQAIQAYVVKAVLLNSATKTTLLPWDNDQQLVGGVITTTQALDWTIGAGRMNLDAAYTQYTGGTTNVTGLTGGSVEIVGWDYGQVSEDTPNEYFITRMLEGDTFFTATLSWFADRAWDSVNNVGTYESFDDLDLEVWSATPGGDALQKIAESISDYNAVEHLHFLLPADGYYLIKVVWDDERYDFVSDVNEQFYGLAWSSIPEPGTMALLGAGGVIMLIRRRRRA